MSQNVTRYNLVISCPGDVEDEIAFIEAQLTRSMNCMQIHSV